MVSRVTNSLRVLQVSTFDIQGGAEKVAWDLFKAYQRRGVDSWLAVGIKQSDDPNVVVLPSDKLAVIWSRLCGGLGARLRPWQDRAPGVERLRTWLDAWASPFREASRLLGIENFNYPGTRRLLELTSFKPDIVHCHNLHGGYFDLRFLSALSKQVPTILTLHDAWLLSGHCAH